MRVLVVDDDDAFRATLRRLLTQEGHSVQIEEAVDGEEALRAVATRPPDVVVMDLTMPRTNGVEATRRLKARWPDLRVVILTAHDDSLYEWAARAAGADGFLLKKTAGTALWPVLARFAACWDPAGPGRAPALAGPCTAHGRVGGSVAQGIRNLPHGGSGMDPIGTHSRARYSSLANRRLPHALQPSEARTTRPDK